MAAVADVLAAPGVRPHLEPLVAPPEGREATSVTLLEDAAGLDDAHDGAIILFTEAASAAAATYRFDIALRLARSRRVSAVVLSGRAFSAITPTAAAIAERSGIAVARTTEGSDLAELCVRIAHEIAGQAEAALERANRAVQAALQRSQKTVEDVIAAAAQELDRPLELRAEAGADDVAAPVVVGGEPDQWLCAGPADGYAEMAESLAVEVIAGRIARLVEAERRSEELPIQSRAELLTELLGARGQSGSQLIRRARALDIPIDGWHVAVRIELDAIDADADTDELAAFEARNAIARIALETARSAGGTWHTARDGPAIVLVHMSREDPGAKAVMDVVRVAERVLKRIERRLDGSVARCGVGSLHSGATGLASTAAEARAGVAAARAAGHENVATAFDSMGLRRTLLEWYASDSARDAVTQILAPLDELGGQRSETAVRTLQTYLDNRGSLTQTAQALGLHRNAVAYRIKKIFSLLEADPENPDDWLLLQLACRSRNLT